MKSSSDSDSYIAYKRDDNDSQNHGNLDPSPHSVSINNLLSKEY